ncbi:MAG TPA: ABC transporter ATP-binding protein [Methanospirillum sp.]|uniref:ABC transporter ATP-binding protein n=1 Tax=Methanospirillum sp. TaxID=45200 RepID=UPI002CCC0A57|nr:ABC transporter ATP-binding protein [Methanospirillum sp.]HOJ97495.1 ABC transporter ATP-binding protein [Methanospirillum sp.]HOL41215.1 ABC transporter ATP-binding protein [Methanospirillum sp.]
MKKNPLLQVSDLSVTFQTNGDTIRAVTGFSCQLDYGICTAIIGESGCGKSVIAHAILRLLPETALVTGSVQFKGKDLYSLSLEELNAIRGRQIGIIFQSPDRALNPTYRIYRQIDVPLRNHQVVPEKKRKDHILTTLRNVGFSHPNEAARLFPCHCSGGMNQRAVTAVVLSLLPDLIIADEPTKGLDSLRVSDVKSSLLKVKDEGRTLLLVTHDICLAQDLSEELLVMYAGEIVESGKTQDILQSPMHPYTRGLLKSLPENGFIPIPGSAPSYANMPSGCRFQDRCAYASERCNNNLELLNKNGRMVRCHLFC